MITFLLTVRKASIHSGLMFSVCVWGGRGGDKLGFSLQYPSLDNHPFYGLGNKISHFCLELASWLGWMTMSLQFPRAWTPSLYHYLDLLYMVSGKRTQVLVSVHQVLY